MAVVLPPWIHGAAHRVGAALNADRVLVFGSNAEGRASRRADLDLFVIARTTLPPVTQLVGP